MLKFHGKKNIFCPLLFAFSRLTLVRWLATSFIGGAVIVLYLLPAYQHRQQQHRQVNYKQKKRNSIFLFCFFPRLGHDKLIRFPLTQANVPLSNFKKEKKNVVMTTETAGSGSTPPPTPQRKFLI